MMENENELELDEEVVDRLTKLVNFYVAKSASLQNNISELKTINTEIKQELDDTKGKLITETEVKEKLDTELKEVRLELGTIKTQRDARPNVASDKYDELLEELDKLKKEKEARNKIREKGIAQIKLLEENQQEMSKVEASILDIHSLLKIKTPPKK